MRRHGQMIDVPMRASFSRASGGGGKTPWHLTLTDDVSRTLVVEVEFSDEAFARMMSSQGEIECAGTIYKSEHHGKRHENKKIHRALPEGLTWGDEPAFAAWQEEIQEGLNTEDGGWALDRETFNSHRISRGESGTSYSFTVRRYVEVT